MQEALNEEGKTGKTCKLKDKMNKIDAFEEHTFRDEPSLVNHVKLENEFEEIKIEVSEDVYDDTKIFSGLSSVDIKNGVDSSSHHVKVEEDEDLLCENSVDNFYCGDTFSDHDVKGPKDGVVSLDSNNHTGMTNVHSNHKCLKNQHCLICYLRSKVKRAFQININSKNEQLRNDQGNYQCPSCDYNTINSSKLTYHIGHLHPQLLIHKCTLCDYSTHLGRNLKTHITAIHLNNRNHMCELCGYNTFRKLNLIQHLAIVHSQGKKFRCHFCYYISKRKSDLKRHVKRMHSEPGNYKCNFCEYSTKRKSSLKIHFNRVHQKIKST